MNNEFFQILSLIFIAVTAIGALFAAFGARSASRATLKASEGQIISQMTNIYGSPEMLRSMMCLIKWKETHGENYVKIFGDLRDRDYDKVKNEDEARRRFTNYYETFEIIKKHKLLNKKIVNDLRTEEQQRFYNNLVRPLCKVVKRKI